MKAGRLDSEGPLESGGGTVTQAWPRPASPGHGLPALDTGLVQGCLRFQTDRGQEGPPFYWRPSSLEVEGPFPLPWEERLGVKPRGQQSPSGEKQLAGDTA